jgi:hypothetical protein
MESRHNLSLVGARGKRATERDEKGALMSPLLLTETNVVDYRARPELSPP